MLLLVKNVHCVLIIFLLKAAPGNELVGLPQQDPAVNDADGHRCEALISQTNL